ncbi:hypothetical protein [Deinococcus actinosclerus]|uniref:Peptidase M43 pregnancy-associated plasma-A domain-containing protein n=1 Tax=Deinococcus actinosclerus TaxID=1768108 RepID=A0ABM5X645_9DEIO|nr:hypothetical protein [Deinococcus actinosclerus]ALW89230.1 hypothetical protein AUC44_10225 [Deinococcus actinosclerus]
MNHKLVATALLSAALLAGCTSPNATTTPTPGTEPGQSAFGVLQALKPGVQDTINTKLKVNIVFVGYRQTPPGQPATARQINTQDFDQRLPGSYDAVNRIPSAYGRTEKTGTSFDFDYNYVFADQSFEDDFFKFVQSAGAEKPLTVQQSVYNCQSSDPDTGLPDCDAPAGNINRVITGNFEIDALKTENWLADNGARVGVKNGEYTIYFVNWYDRPDFKFHSYTRADAADTDTGTKFGARGSRRLIAWGGSARENAPAQRVWFYDLSANPDPWTNAYDVTNDDVDGDGAADYRMPPVWEYGTRKASIGYGRKVSPDLALVARYTAINLLFTPSPIYRAALTPPDMPEKINLDVHVEQGEGATDPTRLLNSALLQDRVKVLQPFTTFSSTRKTTALDGDLADVYKCFFPVVADDICSPDYADFSGEKLFQFGVKELREEYKATPAGTYQLPIYSFNDNQDSQGGLLGVAYDDGETGTQSFVYSFLTPGLVAAGYGFTDTTVHETGHHLSLSHPHDGYDSEQDLSYGPSGQFYFVNTGDQSASIMSYNDLSRTFGQFNLDSQYRYLTAAYLNNTNAILELVRRANKAGTVSSAAQGADSKFVQAKTKYDALDYLGAAQLAHEGYRSVLNAAKSAGVPVTAYKWYENLNGLEGLSVGKGAKMRFSPTFKAQTGVVVFPEETAQQRKLRLMK